ncbi:MAG: hypothetical protein N0E44_12665 [Candidatus Thiodiazotropha lotti]|nr:hypothetical protein [Candidatus Thiodiazotropha lotti]MCW4220740.1 hypothetical protein [Candidatus Thiodiazotropha lotti]
MSYHDTYASYVHDINYKYTLGQERDKSTTIFRTVFISVVYILIVLWNPLLMFGGNLSNNIGALTIYAIIESIFYIVRKDKRLQRWEIDKKERYHFYHNTFEVPKVIPIKYYKYFNVAPSIIMGDREECDKKDNVMCMRISKGIELLKELSERNTTSINLLYSCKKKCDEYFLIDEFITNFVILSRENKGQYVSYSKNTVTTAYEIMGKYSDQEDYYVSFVDIDFDLEIVKSRS